VSCGTGAVDVFSRNATDTRHIANIQTASGARTSPFVPELDELFVAKRAGLLGGCSHSRISARPMSIARRQSPQMRSASGRHDFLEVIREDATTLVFRPRR
jgi:hypothetical protein